MVEINIHQWPFVRIKQGVPSLPSVGWIFLAVNLFATATYTIFAKILTGQISPMTLLFFSELLTIFFTLFSFGFLPTLKKLTKIPRENFAPMFTIGLCNGILGPMLWFSGLSHTTATNAALLGNAENMFLAVLAVLILKEVWNMKHLASVCTILLGIVIISLEGFSEGFQIQPGDLLLILGALNFSMGSLIFRKYLHGTDIELAVLFRSLVPVTMILFLMPFLHFSIPTEVSGLTLSGVAALLGFGLISRFCNTFTFYEAIDHLPVSTVSIFLNLSVIVTISIAHFGLGEALEPYHLIGGALIILGIVLLELTGLHPSKAHAESHLMEKKVTRI
jgi:drug/metabolite transporter (DMT)-like permease